MGFVPWDVWAPCLFEHILDDLLIHLLHGHADGLLLDASQEPPRVHHVQELPDRQPRLPLRLLGEVVIQLAGVQLHVHGRADLLQQVLHLWGQGAQRRGEVRAIPTPPTHHGEPKTTSLSSLEMQDPYPRGTTARDG